MEKVVNKRKLKELIGLLDKVADLLEQNDLRLFAQSGSLAICHKDRPYQELGENAALSWVNSMDNLIDGGDSFDGRH